MKPRPPKRNPWIASCLRLRRHGRLRLQSGLCTGVPTRDALLLANRGFTLLEIIFALAILAGSLAALGEVLRLADRNAALTRDETQAQIIANTIMDELVAGARPLTAVNQAALDPTWEPQWLYSIALEETSYVELLTVRVQVEQQIDERFEPARFELLRWLPNSNYTPATTGGEP